MNIIKNFNHYLIIQPSENFQLMPIGYVCTGHATPTTGTNIYFFTEFGLRQCTNGMV